MTNRKELIDNIIQCVDHVLPFLFEDDGLDVPRAYSFMIDENKRARINIVFEEQA